MLRFLIAAMIALGSTTAAGVTIGVFADSAGTDCSLAIPFPGSTVDVFVVASLEGLAPDGVAGGAFRIVGMPAGWKTEIISTPEANSAVGDVFGSGAWIAYPTCVLAERQVLMKVAITPTSMVQDVALLVEANQVDPANCFLSLCGPCPRFCGCEGLPACYCAAGVQTRINGPCSVAVANRPWHFVKSRFR